MAALLRLSCVLAAILMTSAGLTTARAIVPATPLLINGSPLNSGVAPDQYDIRSYDTRRCIRIGRCVIFAASREENLRKLEAAKRQLLEMQKLLNKRKAAEERQRREQEQAARQQKQRQLRAAQEELARKQQQLRELRAQKTAEQRRQQELADRQENQRRLEAAQQELARKQQQLRELQAREAEEKRRQQDFVSRSEKMRQLEAAQQQLEELTRRKAEQERVEREQANRSGKQRQLQAAQEELARKQQQLREMQARKAGEQQQILEASDRAEKLRRLKAAQIELAERRRQLKELQARKAAQTRQADEAAKRAAMQHQLNDAKSRLETLKRLATERTRKRQVQESADNSGNAAPTNNSSSLSTPDRQAKLLKIEELKRQLAEKQRRLEQLKAAEKAKPVKPQIATKDNEVNQQRSTSSGYAIVQGWRQEPGNTDIEYIDTEDGYRIFRAGKSASTRDKTIVTLRNLRSGAKIAVNEPAKKVQPGAVERFQESARQGSEQWLAETSDGCLTKNGLRRGLSCAGLVGAAALETARRAGNFVILDSAVTAENCARDPGISTDCGLFIFEAGTVGKGRKAKTALSSLNSIKAAPKRRLRIENDGAIIYEYSDDSVRDIATGKFASSKGLPRPGTRSAKEFTELLRVDGYDIVGEEVYVQGIARSRVYDAVIKDDLGRLWGVEYKTGTGRKTLQQDFNDLYINRHGGETFGRFKGLEIYGNMTIYLQ